MKKQLTFHECGDNMDIDWSKIVKHTIDVGKLNVPSEISNLMKTFKIRKYLYSIRYKGILLKYGMSADNSRIYGDRVYRQVGHSKSWENDPVINNTSKRLNGSSGSDWRVVEEDFEKLYGFPIDRKQMMVTIYDVTNYPFKTIDTWTEINVMENDLIERYRELVGEKPIGNINDEANAKRRPKILKSTWGGLFK
jgi:hypothetical protein